MPSISLDQTPIIARPLKDFFVIIGFWIVVGIGLSLAVWLIPIEPTRPDSLTVAQALASLAFVFLLPGAFMLWLMRRLRLVADARGLTIYRAFKTQFIGWHEIEDYELRAAPQAATARESWIRAHEKWQRLPQLHANLDALRARIQREATSSHAREWQLNIARDDAHNWPKTYVYRDPSGRKGFATIIALLLLYVGLTLGRTSPATSIDIIRDIWNNLEWWGRLGFAAMPLIGLGVVALLLLPQFAIMRAKKTLGRQIIRADQISLTLLDGDAQTRIEWSEITDYYFEDASGPITLHQCVAQSASERIVFRLEIDNYGELKALIRVRAVNAKSRDWRALESADSDTLGGENSLWLGGVAGIGRKVYHYRTRTMRAIIGLGAAILCVLVFGSVSSMLRRGWNSQDIWVLLIFVVPVAIATILGALAFRFSSIQTDENGLFQRGIWGARALRWDEIEAFYYQGYFYEVKGQSTIIRYSDVAARKILQDEIEARSGHKMRRPNSSVGEE